MNYFASWSGGKDCLLALERLHADPQWQPCALLTTVTRQFGRVSMHGIRNDVLRAQAAALGLPLTECALAWPSSNADYETAMARALQHARARFDGVRVTSQSRTAAEADTNYGDGRPFVLYEDGSTLDITDSFFSFLGSDRSSAYGVSWRTGGTNGTITDSTFSNNFFGMYSYEAANLTFIDNSFKDAWCDSTSSGYSERKASLTWASLPFPASRKSASHRADT